jgi:hypothetical protein
MDGPLADSSTCGARVAPAGGRELLDWVVLEAARALGPLGIAQSIGIGFVPPQNSKCFCLIYAGGAGCLQILCTCRCAAYMLDQSASFAADGALRRNDMGRTQPHPGKSLPPVCFVPTALVGTAIAGTLGTHNTVLTTYCGAQLHTKE